MRNLKRVLSLTLASVMLLGMMVVGSSAAAGYSDVDENDNVEAIEVLQTVQVMVGDDRGFGPDRPVTRNEMAVVMGKLLNLDYNYYSETCPFTDVANWAKGWVGACYANGIVSGRGNGIYDGEATVTAVEAASMMMRALGYFKYQNDYADGFQVSTVRQGTKIGIFDQVGTDATSAMTRNQVAQMALNALKSGMVEPDGNTINLTTPDGSVFTGKVNYVNVTSYKDFARAISETQASSAGSTNLGYIVELGEQLYNGKLKLDDNQLDDFRRPARRWEYDGKEIGTYVKKELLRAEYTDEVTGKMLYELLGSAVTEVQPITANTYSFLIAIDGENANGASGVLVNEKGDDFSFNRNDMIRTNTDGVGGTGKGVLTQVYVDGDKKIVYIAVINTYLGIAAEDYDEKDDEVDLDVYNVEDLNDDPKAPLYVKAKYKNTTDDSINITIPGDDFAIKDVKDGDKFLIRVAKGEVQEMVAPEIVSEATATAFKKRADNSPEYVIANGTQYDAANTALYDVEVLYNWTGSGLVNLKDLTYNVILDHYGYMIGVELNEDPNQYVFITGSEGGSSNLGDKNVDMGAIFTDGTFKVITVNTKDSKNSLAPGSVTAAGPIVNTWCTYTVDKNDVYTLKQVGATIAEDNRKVAQYDMNCKGSGAAGADATININKKHVSLDASGSTFAYGNDKSVYLNVSLSAITSKTDFTAADQNTETGVFAATDKKYHTAEAAANTNIAAIIDEVESVTVGVKNADIKVTNVTKDTVGNMDGKDYSGTNLVMPLNEVYTLYDEDMYIIAAVVIGEAQYSNSSYAYIQSSGIGRESYDKDADEWTWTRSAIVEGEVTTLKEVGSQPKYLEDLAQGHWYKLNYDADGNVRGVTTLDGNDDRAKELDNSVKTDGFISDVADKDEAVDAEDFVILRVMFREDGVNEHTGDALCDEHNIQDAKGYLTFKEGTLYTDYRQTEGFSVSPEVKVILAQAKGSTEFDKLYTNYPNSYEGLKRALRALNTDEDGYFSGDISAVLEGGVATSIIINDIGEKDANGGGNNPPPADGDVTKDPTGGYNIDEYAGTMDAYFVHGAKGGAQKAAEDALIAEGFTIKSVAADGKITATKNGVDRVITPTATEFFKITVDSTVYYVTEDGYAKGENTEYQLPLSVDTYDDADTDGTGYLDGAGVYQDYATTGNTVAIKAAAMGSDTDITDNKTIKTKYVEFSGTATALTGTSITYKVGNAAATSTRPTGVPVGTTSVQVIATVGSSPIAVHTANHTRAGTLATDKGKISITGAGTGVVASGADGTGNTITFNTGATALSIAAGAVITVTLEAEADGSFAMPALTLTVSQA